MGRGEKGKRLANPDSKMAEQVMAGFPEIFRSVHEAVKTEKVICPEQHCYKDMAFLEERGLGHHY